MMVSWINFAILVQLISITAYVEASKQSKGENGSSESNECDDGQCLVENSEPLSAYKIDENVSKEEHEKQPNVFELIQLLSLLSKNGKGSSITLNIRDIQSGFKNFGRLHHVGNVHKQREKRDTSSELQAVTDESGDMGTSLAVTDPIQNNVVVSLQSPQIESGIDNGQVNDNTSVEVTVRHEVDNFQDPNAADIHDSVTNDTTTIPVNANDSSVLGNDQSNETVLQNYEVVNNGDSRKSLSNSSEVNIPLSHNDLDKIQNVLNDDLGIKSKGAEPVANFTLNGRLSAGNKNPVVVLVYNCSCGNTNEHTHNNSTDVVKNNDDINNNDEVWLKSRRMMSDDEPEHTTQQTESENEPLPQATEQSKNEHSNALLENKLLQECNSLLSVQLENKSKDSLVSETKNLNEDSISPQQANEEASNQITQNDVTLQENDPDKLNIIQNLETDNINNVNNDSAITPLENDTINIQLQNDNETNVNSLDLNSDLEPTVPVNENVNTDVNTVALKLPSLNIPEVFDSKRKRRSIQDDIQNVLSNIMHFANTFSFDPTGDTEAKYRSQVNSDSVKAIFDSVNEGNKSQLSARKKRDTADILNYINKHNVVETNNADDYKDASTKTKSKAPSRKPKYYEYANDKPNLLESEPTSKENDGTIIDFKSLNAKNVQSFSDEQHQEDFILNVVSKDGLPSQDSEEIRENMEDVSELLRLKPVFNINIYIKLLLKDFGKDQEMSIN